MFLSQLSACGSTARMDVFPETKLNKKSTFSYKSFGSSSELADVSLPNDFASDLTKHGEKQTRFCSLSLLVKN